MRRRAEHQREHADPRDLVDERRERRPRGHPQQHARQPPHRRRRFVLAAGERVGGEPVVVVAAGPGSAERRRDGTGRRDGTCGRRRVLRAPAPYPLGEHRRERDQQVEDRRGVERARQSRHRNEDEPREHAPGGGAERVREVEQREQPARLRGLRARGAQHAGAHHRERHAQQHRLRQDQQRGDAPLGDLQQHARAQRRKEHIVGEPSDLHEQVVEDQADQSRHQFDARVPEQRAGHARRALRHRGGTQRHAAEEDHEHDHLRVRAVPHEEPEVAAPDRLVDEARNAREDERRDQDEDHGPGRCR